MLKQGKNKRKSESVSDEPVKKIKKADNNHKNLEKSTKSTKKTKTSQNVASSDKPNINANTNIKDTPKINNIKTIKTRDPSITGHTKKSNKFTKGKFKSFDKKHGNKLTEKPADWNEFKKKKKELQLKRKQNRGFFDVITKAKKIGEELRRKNLDDAPEKRKKMTEELHALLGGQNNYPKYVLSHDMARIVQYMLKFSPENIKREIAQELIPSTVEMIQSKYAKFCVKHMLKHGDAKTRSEVLRACYGHAVKLTSHAVSSEILNYGFTTWATPLEKRHLIQEFYGDMYKNTKDDSLTHIRDIYKTTTDMKAAVLGAMKANLSRIMNKELLDSHIVQTVISQYLDECSQEDRLEIISQLSEHVVILSNSKEGAHATMLCFWHGTNKDRKVMMKTIKEHIVSMCKHEYAHNTIICILDSVDDTVLLKKTFLTEILANAEDLVGDEWGRKVLLWLVAPGDKAYFHPTYLNELSQGREKSVSKKEVNIRREEILKHCIGELLQKITDNTNLWFQNVAIAVVTFAIFRAGKGSEAESAYSAVANVIADPDWKIKENEKETVGVEDPGFHIIIKKLLHYQKNDTNPLFSLVLVDAITEKTLKKWIKSETGCNRACFLLVNILENSSLDIQNKLKEKFNKKIRNILEEKENVKGASILLKKIT